MANYREMYLHLFGEITTVIDKLQAATQETETMYIESDDSPITLHVDHRRVKRNKY